MPLCCKCSDAGWKREMSRLSVKTAESSHIELAVSRLDDVAILPAVAAELLCRLNKLPAAHPSVAEVIESDPAAAAKIISLARSHAIALPQGQLSISHILQGLPDIVVRQAVLSLRIFQPTQAAADAHNGPARTRCQLQIHSLAVACCARRIAESTLSAVASPAYVAGLLHDIGKFAMQELLPKSFQRIIAEAAGQPGAVWTIEQKYLGLDHTLIGKRLAENWRLPPEVVLAVWLHHTAPEAISEVTPAWAIARIVALADLMVRRIQIADSRNYDRSDSSIAFLARSFSLTPEQIDSIQEALRPEVEHKCSLLQQAAPVDETGYSEAVRKTALRLASQTIDLVAENRRLAVSCLHNDFVSEFCCNLDPDLSPLEVAGVFARKWQKFYQTGPVCVCLLEGSPEGLLETAVVTGSGELSTVLVKPAAGPPPSLMPAMLQTKFVLLDSLDEFAWLLEQIDIGFDPARTRAAPLLARRRTVGVIIFETRYQAEHETQADQFAAVAATGAAAIAMAMARRNQQELAEHFAAALAEPSPARRALTEQRLFSSLAELAAGAAHELNTPLAIISGRAQLLQESETDPDRKNMLDQIRSNADEVSQIIADLLNFANPAQPAPRRTTAAALFDRAIRQLSGAGPSAAASIRLHNIDALPDVTVDPEQVSSALAHILRNALESYDVTGAVNVSGKFEPAGKYVSLQIADFGSGMTPEMLERAAQPFFSSKPAGRKRGMGLAHAQRLIFLNNGLLSIASTAGQGTTVTVLLSSWQGDRRQQ